MKFSTNQPFGRYIISFENQKFDNFLKVDLSWLISDRDKNEILVEGTSC